MKTEIIIYTCDKCKKTGDNDKHYPQGWGRIGITVNGATEYHDCCPLCTEIFKSIFEENNGT